LSRKKATINSLPGASELNPPRIVVSGLGGDSGKTMVSLGLLFLARERDLPVGAFKKGPDYIDAAWLSWASGRPARNLDGYLMGYDVVRSSFLAWCEEDGLNVVEGNRGLYDGSDEKGTHSTYRLAKELSAPVILVCNAAKVTRTLAACVLGCMKMDPETKIAGVVLNRVGGSRHESVLRRSIERECGLPVLGALPAERGGNALPGRHLGLVTPEEHPELENLRKRIESLCSANLDLEGILSVARRVEPPDGPESARFDFAPDAEGLKIGFIRDSAFTFYYPENLEILEAAGAELVGVSPLEDERLPAGLNGLYIGGGFPETHAAKLSSNASWLADLKRFAGSGGAVYAECGGLMLLSRAIIWKGKRYPMTGVLPFDVRVEERPQGHGYTELEVDRDNHFFLKGTRLKGHEFHYSLIVSVEGEVETACRALRGNGIFDKREGIILGNVWASYTHLHALGSPGWAGGFLCAALGAYHPHRFTT